MALEKHSVFEKGLRQHPFFVASHVTIVFLQLECRESVASDLPLLLMSFPDNMQAALGSRWLGAVTFFTLISEIC